MAYKNRGKPYTLVMLEALDKRMELNNEDRMNQQYSASGIEGEYRLDVKTETLKHCRVLNDLFLKTNGSSFQIDALVITSKKVLLYEVKNYEGEYLYQGDQLHKIKTSTNIFNPVSRLTRTKLLFEQLLRKNGFANIQVEAYVVFIHPHFTLYDCPAQQPILFPSNIDQHFEQLAAEAEPLNQRFNLLSERLCELIIPDDVDFNLPKYTYAELKKDLFCSTCGAQKPI